MTSQVSSYIDRQTNKHIIVCTYCFKTSFSQIIWISIVMSTSYTDIALYCLTASASLITSLNSRGCNLPVQAQKSMAGNSCLPRILSSPKNFHLEHITEKPDRFCYLSTACGFGQLLLQLRNMLLCFLYLFEQSCGRWSAILFLQRLKNNFMSFHSVSPQCQSFELQPTTNLHSITHFK